MQGSVVTTDPGVRKSLEMAFEWTSAEQALRAIGRLGSTGQR